MPIQTLNPATGKIEKDFKELSPEELETKITKADTAYGEWKKTTISERSTLMKKAAAHLRTNSEKYGSLITTEMGKPVEAAIKEIKKCADVCDYYAENAEAFLTPSPRETDAKESFVRYDPIGPVLAVMPWNFPFWQVLRFAAPTLMAGNVGLLKHASNVPQSSLAIEETFREAGFPEGVFTSLLISSSQVETVLRDPRVQAVTLTGSEKAGASVASIAGQEIKKSVLELGGSDPFIVRSDVDIQAVAEQAVIGRFQNSGQSCIAAKRFIVMEDIAEEFTEAFKVAVAKHTVGDPTDITTKMGPVVDEKAMLGLLEQVNKSVSMGATIVTGGKQIAREGFFLEPTVLSGVTKGMPVYDEETFGPVAAIITAKDDENAIRIANDSKLGLGSSIWTKDIETAKGMAAQIESGSVFINSIVVSDINLPFGGTKRSGYGRELAREGILEFVNVKTVKVREL
jgi:succinate-semialdehyde dehydrogenase/glutarate-semialdehyde dehydrogenase